jgi:hypothetical protein
MAGVRACSELQEGLTALAHGELPPREAAPLREHVAACAGCAALLADIAEVRKLAAAFPPARPSDRFRARMAALREELSAGRPRPRRLVWWVLPAAAALAALAVLLPPLLREDRAPRGAGPAGDAPAAPGPSPAAEPLASVRLREFGARWPGPARDVALARHGGDAASEAAVARSLLWLAGFQARDGSFAGADGGERVRGTALVALSFLGAGNGRLAGEHRVVVARALEWLERSQDEHGGIGPRREGRTTTPHVIATLALLEDWVMREGEGGGGPAIQRALAALDPSSADDEDALPWLASVVHLARKAPFTLDRRLVAALGERGARDPGPGAPGAAANAWFTRLLIGPSNEALDQRDQSRALFSEDARAGPSAAWSFAALAWTLDPAVGRPARMEWNQELRAALRRVQASPDLAGGGDPGRELASTALRILVLESYYRLSTGS